MWKQEVILSVRLHCVSFTFYIQYSIHFFASFFTNCSCGWHQVCATENSDDRYQWHRWEKVEYKIDEETGQSSSHMEFIPHTATRAEFMKEFKGMFSKWLPHERLTLLVYQSFKKQEELLSRVKYASKLVCDYASQINVNRFFSSTCTHEAKINLCVLVLATDLTKEEKFYKGKSASEYTTKIVESQRTDVFYGLFDCHHKGSAQHHKMMHEDAIHYMKKGTSVYGEMYVDGQRIPMKGGEAHQNPLPAEYIDEHGNVRDITNFEFHLTDKEWVSDKKSAEDAECPYLEWVLGRYDGCSGQYAGNKATANVGRSILGPSGVRCLSGIQVAMHGKALADPYGFLVKKYLGSNIQAGKTLEAGARNAVLYLAQHHPRIVSEKGEAQVNMKSGVWSAERLIYIFYPEELWSKTPCDIKQSMPKKYHSRSSVPTPQPIDIVTQYGKVICRPFVCPCPKCLPPICDYNNCMLKTLVGNMETLSFKEVPSFDASLTRQRLLTEFSSEPRSGQVRAVAVDEREQVIEGTYWLINNHTDCHTTGAKVRHWYCSCQSTVL